MTTGYPIAAYAHSTREELILRHLQQVNFIAARIHETLASQVPEEDVVSAGILGLIAAVDNYRPESGVKLSTYAEHRIRGAIYDSLRQTDWASRRRRQKMHEIQKAIADAEQRLGRAPADEEIAQELGIPPEQYYEWLAYAQVMSIGSLDALVENGMESRILTLHDDSEDGAPDRMVERAELEKLLNTALSRMPKLERTVLSLYFIEELTLKEIGDVIGVGITRACQLKTQALLRLRNYIGQRWPIVKGGSAR
jgi:RNA polymerase sigma factor for flagellar operon FliA